MSESPQAPAAAPTKDFFVSRTGADAAWAQWIAWQLEAAGYRVVIQDWDFGPGVNFVHKMQQAATDAKRTIAILSPRYFQSSFTEAEWTTAFYRDPSGEKGLLLPIRIEKFAPPGMLGTRTYLDVFDLDEDTARQHLLNWIRRAGNERVKPEHEPGFPGSANTQKSAASAKPEPNYPGQMPPMFGLPARNCNFAGRETLLNELRSSLVAGRAAVLTAATRQVAAHGLGGTGKTQLAIEYAWRWASDYARVIWVQAEIPEALSHDFDALADELGLFNGNKPTEQAKVIAAVREHLEKNPGWLLIFDNAPEPRAVKGVVPRSGGQVIFTSRYTAWGKQAVPLRVDVWPPEEAEQFLLQRVGAKGEEQARRAAAQLAEELGYLPLALEHAGAYCEQSSLTLADYLLLFRDRRLELFSPETLEETLGGDQEMITVTTTWNLALDRIRDQEKCPEAGALFTLCAFLAPDQIPLETVQTGADYLPEPLSGALRSDLKVNKVLATLLRYSLVAVQGGGKERVLSVHRLLQEVTRERLSEEEKRSWITAAVQIVNKAFPTESDDVRAWPACGRLAAHAVAVLHYAEPRDIEHEVTARLLNQLAGYALARGKYAEAEPLFQRALAIYEKALGPDHPYVAASLNNLAGLYHNQGKYAAAEPLYQRALAIYEKALGPDHPDVATSLNGLAELYRNQGKYAAAEPLYQRSRAIWEKALGPDHPRVATSLNNLALLYYNQGKYAEAEPLCRRALAIREKALGPDHPDVAQSLSGLAVLYDNQGKYAEAEPLYQRSRAIYEKALGPDHPHVATSLNNLAVLYNNQGKYAEAEPLFQRALAIWEKALGPDHPHVATSLNNLAVLYKNQGKFAEAEPLFERSLAIREKALGPDHPNTATVRSNYVALLRKMGREAEAIAVQARRPRAKR
jgi:tetratricopeptide (TPR) repeat protein